jgi:hypothetical protein
MVDCNIRVLRCRLRFSRLLNTLEHWLQLKDSENPSAELEAERSCDWLTNGGASSGATGARAVDIIAVESVSSCGVGTVLSGPLNVVKRLKRTN